MRQMLFITAAGYGARIRSCSWPWLTLAIVVGSALLPDRPLAQAQSSGSASAAKVLLGEALFFDTNLSTPVGQACGSCHLPAAGFTFPDPIVNELLGPVPGAVDGRFGNRKPPTVSYAAYLPAGPPTFDTALNKYVGGFFWDGRAPTLLRRPRRRFRTLTRWTTSCMESVRRRSS